MEGDFNGFHTPPKPFMTKNGLEIPATPFLNCLGVGTCVNVWRLDNPTATSPWAVKSVRKAMESDRHDKYQKLIEKEANILSNIEHENIIGYRGLLKSLDGRKCLAMESGGRSLGDLIEERSESGQKRYSPKEIIKVVLSCAKALDYLHSTKRLLHGDIKSYNILIKGNFEVVKLCDLGVCVPLNLEGYSTEYCGTLIYNAPEVLNESLDVLKITGKAEIFSLGLVIYEMIALSIPHCDRLEDTLESSFNDSISVNGLDSSQASWFAEGTLGSRPKLPANLEAKYAPIVEIYNLCTEANPDDRPSAAQLIRLLEKS